MFSFVDFTRVAGARLGNIGQYLHICTAVSASGGVLEGQRMLIVYNLVPLFIDVVEDSLDDNGYPETSNDENQRRRLRTASKSFRNMGSKRERRSLPARSPKVASRDSSEPGREDSVSPLAIAADHVAHMTGLDEESESYYDDTPRSDGQQNRVADRDLLTKLARNARDRKGTIGDREESFIHRRISYALQELEDVLSSQDGQEILRAEAKLRWAFDHNAIQEVTFSRASKVRVGPSIAFCNIVQCALRLLSLLLSLLPTRLAAADGTHRSKVCVSTTHCSASTLQ